MRSIVTLGLIILAGCMPKPYAPPSTAPTDRRPTDVSAPFGRTWDAAIDVFTTAGFSMENLDKPSGLLIPHQAQYTAGDTVYADCGTAYPNTPDWRHAIGPTSAKFNVVIRSDSSRGSTVLVRAFFSSGYVANFGPTNPVDCVSRGAFEAMMERRIKLRAEERP